MWPLRLEEESVLRSPRREPLPLQSSCPFDPSVMRRTPGVVVTEHADTPPGSPVAWCEKQLRERMSAGTALTYNMSSVICTKTIGRFKKKRMRSIKCFTLVFAVLNVASCSNVSHCMKKKSSLSFSWKNTVKQMMKDPFFFFKATNPLKVCRSRPHTHSSERRTAASSLWHLPLCRDIFRVPVKINHDRAHPHKTLSNSHWLLSAVQAVKWSLAKGSWTTLNNQSEATTAPHCTPVLPLHYTQTIIQVDTSDT